MLPYVDPGFQSAFRSQEVWLLVLCGLQPSHLELFCVFGGLRGVKGIHEQIIAFVLFIGFRFRSVFLVFWNFKLRIINMTNGINNYIILVLNLSLSVYRRWLKPWILTREKSLFGYIHVARSHCTLRPQIWVDQIQIIKRLQFGHRINRSLFCSEPTFDF